MVCLLAGLGRGQLARRLLFGETQLSLWFFCLELFSFFRREFPWGQVSDGWGCRGVSCCSLCVTKMGQGSWVDSTVQLYLPFLKATLIKSQISLKFQGWTDNHFLKSHIHGYVLSDSLCLSWKTDQPTSAVSWVFVYFCNRASIHIPSQLATHSGDWAVLSSEIYLPLPLKGARIESMHQPSYFLTFFLLFFCGFRIRHLDSTHFPVPLYLPSAFAILPLK